MAADEHIEAPGEEALPDEELVVEESAGEELVEALPEPPKVYTLTPQGVVLAIQFEDGDRLFRDSWVSDGDVITVDMDKARDIHMQRIRAARGDALESNDTEWLAATKRGDAAAARVAEEEAQRLRDLPQTVDLSTASTPSELMAIWP